VLYDRHAAEAGRPAYLLTGDRHLAEDLVHEAFIKAGLRFAHLRNKASFPAYLRRTIVNLCRSHWRRESVRRRFIQEAKPPEPAYQPDLGQRSEVGSALRRLSTRQRMTVVLSLLRGPDEEQTADVLGWSGSGSKRNAPSALKRSR
jgi:RNA polymerase sigma factor (sigma-70 family)